MTIPEHRPLRPDEAAALKAAVLPPVVWQAFNELIARAWDGRAARVFKDDAVARIRELDSSITPERIRAEHLLDVEPAYREAGWDVLYDRPGLGESYPASYTFTLRSPR